jgi:hypothetical protein
MSYEDCIGKKFARLTVISFDATRSNRCKRRFICDCECGARVVVVAGNLVNGMTKSCGCYKADMIRARIWRGVGNLSQTYWQQVMKSARCRGISLEVDKEYCWSLFLAQGERCAITGIPLVMDRKGRSGSTASLDRISSELGYVPGNVQWVHKHINIMKSSHSQDYFVELCRAVVAHQDAVGLAA